MKDILENLYHAGKGFTKLKKEDLEKIFIDLKEKGELEEEDRDTFITKALNRLEEAGKNITEKIKQTFSPEHERVDKLNEKIDELIKEVEKLKKKK